MDKFNTKHFAFLILATTVVSLKTYPDIYIRTGGRDAWVAMSISSLIILAYFVYGLKTFKRHNTFSLYEVYIGALGKGVGKGLMGLFALTLLLTLVEGASIEAHSMHSHMLLETPHWYFLPFFVLPTLYTVQKGLVSIVIVVVIGIVLIMISGINLGIMTAPYKEVGHLLPIFEEGVTRGFLLSILQTLGLYGCVSIVLPYLTEMGDKKKLLKHSVIGLLIVIQMQIVSVTGVIMTFGADRVTYMSYPKLLQTQLVSHFRFLEVGELFVMLQILGGWYLKYVVTFYALLKILANLGVKSKFTPFIISGIVLVAGYFASSNLFTILRLMNYYAYICLVNFVIIPWSVLVAYNIRFKKEKKKRVVQN